MPIDLDSIDLFGDSVSASSIATVEAPKSLPEVAATAQRTRRHGVKPVSDRGLFYFDLETVPDETREPLFGLEPLPEAMKRSSAAEMGADLPSVLLAKTVEKITEIVEAKLPDDEFLDAMESAERARQKGPRDGVMKLIKKIREVDATRAAAAVARCKEMSVSPEMNRIVAMGWSVDGGKPLSMVVNSDQGGDVTEVVILEKFWSLAAKASKVIGFNVAGFDLPTIYVRSIILGVEPTRQFDLKPWGNDVIDLSVARFPRGPQKDRGLKWLCRALGIEIPAGDDVDGSKVAELFQAGRLDELGKYVRSDVSCSIGLHRAYRGFFCS